MSVQQSLDFLQRWQPDGPWALGAIHPENDTTAWLTTEDSAAARAFIELHADAGRGLYFQPNVVRPDAGGARAQRSDIALACCVFAEKDPPPTVTTPEQLAVWQVETGRQLTSPEYWAALHLPMPSVVIFTGTGWCVMYGFVESLSLWAQAGDRWVQDKNLVEAVQYRNRYLTEAIGGDRASVDVSRLMRLPGSVNIANVSKRAHGRTTPVLAEVVYHVDPRYTLDDLPAWQPPLVEECEPRVLPQFTGRPSQEKWDQAVSLITTVWPPQGERHNAFLVLAGALAHANWPANAITDFTQDVARMMSGVDDKAVADRPEMARRSVEMLQNGELVTGWPRLASIIGDGPCRAAQAALGIQTGPVKDPAFDAAIQKLAEKSRPVVTQVDVEAALVAQQKRLASSRDPAKQAEAEYIRRARASHFLTDDPSEDPRLALAKAAIAVAKALPQGCQDPSAHVRRVLLGSAGSLSPELTEVAALAVDSLTAEQDVTAASEFELVMTGPRALQPANNSQRNFDIACARLGVSFRYDAFACRKLITPAPDAEEQVVEDHHVIELGLQIEREFNFEPTKDKLYDLVESRSRLRTFHPVLDYIDGLPAWDGVSRVERWLVDLAGAEDTPFVRAVSRLVLVAAVRRVRRPGCKYDEMLILESDQGTRKSLALQTLCPRREWFTDDVPLDLSTKELIERITGRWIVEAGELRGMRPEAMNQLKSMLSRVVDQARMAYGRENRILPRQCVLVGTTNEDKYLVDSTGDRRYWPVRIVEFDLEALREIRDQLWAETAYLDLHHPEESYIRLDPSLYKAAADEQVSRRVDDPMAIVLYETLVTVPEGSLHSRDVWLLLGFATDRQPSRMDQSRMASALRGLGWLNSRRHEVGGRRGTWFHKGDPMGLIPLGVTGNSVTGFRVGVVMQQQGVSGSSQSDVGAN